MRSSKKSDPTPTSSSSDSFKRIGRSIFMEINGQEELANRTISGLIMHGALSEAGKIGFRLEAHHTSHMGLREAVQNLRREHEATGIAHCLLY